MTAINKRLYTPSNDVVREFTFLYDKGDKTIQKLVDAWHGAKDFGEIDMIECQMESYKKCIGHGEVRNNED
jgi:hypothetical protein